MSRPSIRKNTHNGNRYIFCFFINPSYSVVIAKIIDYLIPDFNPGFKKIIPADARFGFQAHSP
jgi:hypothetical protein